MPPEMINPADAPRASYVSAALCARGFNCTDRGWERDGLFLRSHGRWFVLEDHGCKPGAVAAAGSIGGPGLWKVVRNGAPDHLVFEVPSWAVSNQAEDDLLDEAGPAPFAKLLDWALVTRGGQAPRAWRSPKAERVRSWIRPGALTVEARGCVRQGELILEPDRWALRIPILAQLAPDLDEARRRTLIELAEEGQHHWAMARVGVLVKALPSSMLAEVDFTGAPHSELLFSAGLDVLRHVVAWLAETADAVGNPKIVITSLASGIDNITHNTERNTV